MAFWGEREGTWWMFQWTFNRQLWHHQTAMTSDSYDIRQTWHQTAVTSDGCDIRQQWHHLGGRGRVAGRVVFVIDRQRKVLSVLSLFRIALADLNVFQRFRIVNPVYPCIMSFPRYLFCTPWVHWILGSQISTNWKKLAHYLIYMKIFCSPMQLAVSIRVYWSACIQRVYKLVLLKFFFLFEYKSVILTI